MILLGAWTVASITSLRHCWWRNLPASLKSDFFLQLIGMCKIHRQVQAARERLQPHTHQDRHTHRECVGGLCRMDLPLKMQSWDFRSKLKMKKIPQPHIDIVWCFLMSHWHWCYSWNVSTPTSVYPELLSSQRVCWLTVTSFVSCAPSCQPTCPHTRLCLKVSSLCNWFPSLSWTLKRRRSSQV